MNRNEIKSVSVSDSALNGFLNIILEGRGNESLEKRQEIMKAIMNAKEIDDKFISNMYQLFKAVDFFYDNDTLLESLISERVYNILNYNTTIDVNNSLSDLLKKVISALGNVIKYGYAVVGIRRNESAEVNRTADLDADIKFIPNYDIDFMLLDTYDIFYYEGEFQTANLEKITAFLDEGYSFYEMYSHKKKGSVIAVLKDLIQKHYTDSNWYNGISGLIGINICKINIDEVMNDISIITGKKIENQSQAMILFQDYIMSENKKLRSGDMVTITDNISYGHESFTDVQIGSLANDFIKKKDEVIQIAIIGQAGTTMDSQKGSYNQAEVIAASIDNNEFSPFINYLLVVNLFKHYFCKVIFGEKIWLT